MSEFYRDPAKITTFLETWIKEKFAKANARGGVLGLSGGVDSAVLSALLRRICSKDDMLAVIMPCHSAPEDEEDAMLIAEALDIPIKKVDLTPVYEAAVSSMKSISPLGDGPLSNIKPRLRMTALYAAAQENNFLVCGGSNKNEITFGYFTKHGDSAVDILPMGDLLKGEVFLLADYLGVPKSIIEKSPSAGLKKGQTDEDDMGITYADMDRYIATGEADDRVRRIILEAYLMTAHKREYPPIAVIETS